ncbi:MlaD family protein [Piscinibacter sp.]|jgi:phospholipid/cholesterol/gamma-HCH transport system substrate-binding protein|uniref:MlaD family protein n=1 Tax=Piscinibacter sp. TaxID=1903157 RepID=UPI003559881D
MNEEPSASPPPVAHLEFKAAMLLLLMLLLLSGAAVYLMYARGAFEATQKLVLVADDAEGVMVGMDLTFSGFPIGRVRRIELGQDGNARIIIDVPSKDAHWLRESSVFTLVHGLVGSTNIRAFSGILSDPPLPDGAERKALIGDATAEIPHLLSAAKELIQNLTVLTAADSPLSASLANVQSATDKLKGPRGALGVLLGNEADAGKLVTALDRANSLLARIDAMAARADTQVFGKEGVMPETRSAIVQLNAMLGDARATLKKVDAVLEEAQGVASNARVATTDLGALRAEVESSLRKVEGLVDEVNRKWPFARDTELKLP